MTPPFVCMPPPQWLTTLAREVSNVLLPAWAGAGKAKLTIATNMSFTAVFIGTLPFTEPMRLRGRSSMNYPAG